MRCPKTRTILLAATLAALLTAILPADALAAAGSGDAIGQNLGTLLTGWARSLFGGVVAIVSIVFLVNRRYPDLALFVSAAVVVGGLIFATPTVANVIRSIWTTVGA